MNKIFYILFFSFFFMNCTSNTIIKKPDNLISKELMVDLLTDMYLANGATNIKSIQLERNPNYFPLVYQKYQIDSTRFKESNFYYTSRIDDYDNILNKVDLRLKGLRKKYEDEKEVQDSIKKEASTPKKRLKKDLKQNN